MKFNEHRNQDLETELMRFSISDTRKKTKNDIFQLILEEELGHVAKKILEVVKE